MSNNLRNVFTWTLSDPPHQAESTPKLVRRLARLFGAEADGHVRVGYTEADASRMLDECIAVANVWVSRERWSDDVWQKALRSLEPGYTDRAEKEKYRMGGSGEPSVGFDQHEPDRAKAEQLADGFVAKWGLLHLGPSARASFAPELAAIGTAGRLARNRMFVARDPDRLEERTHQVEKSTTQLKSTGGDSMAPDDYVADDSYIVLKLMKLAAAYEPEIVTVPREHEGLVYFEAVPLSLRAFLWMHVMDRWNRSTDVRLCGHPGCNEWFEANNKRTKFCELHRQKKFQMRLTRARRLQQKEGDHGE